MTDATGSAPAARVPNAAKVGKAALRGLLLLLCACSDSPPSPSPQPPPPTVAQVGQWSAVRPAPIVQLHLHLLLDGKVLSWGRLGDPQLWDPATGSFTAVPSPSWLFCAGHDYLPDGRLFVAGGHIRDLYGLPNANVFDPGTATWQALPPMAAGRWYPTTMTLANGHVLILAGTDSAAAHVTIPEVWDGTSWRQLTGADLQLPYYPRTFVAPDGRVFYAGEGQQSLFLDVTGPGSWTGGPLRTFGTRDYGSAVMYEPGKILYVGGGDPPTNTAEIIDLNEANPAWRSTGSMRYARRQIDATLLPTGEVLVTGGTSGSGFNNPVGAVHVAELWNPATGRWTQLAANSVTRIYHGTTLLLPDGRLLHTGSGDGGMSVSERNFELYSPPYLFKGPRPTMTGAVPGAVGYGDTVVVGTPDRIVKVTLVRFGSVTHALDQGQRLVPLTFSQVANGVSIAFPATGGIAPPGPYILFLVNWRGVPSEGKIVLLGP